MVTNARRKNSHGKPPPCSLIAEHCLPVAPTQPTSTRALYSRGKNPKGKTSTAHLKPPLSADSDGRTQKTKAGQDATATRLRPFVNATPDFRRPLRTNHRGRYRTTLSAWQIMAFEHSLSSTKKPRCRQNNEHKTQEVEELLQLQLLSQTEDAALNYAPVVNAVLGAPSFCSSVRVMSSQFPSGYRTLQYGALKSYTCPFKRVPFGKRFHTTKPIGNMRRASERDKEFGGEGGLSTGASGWYKCQSATKPSN